MQSHTTRKRIPLQERFWSYVNKTERCWIWTGARFNQSGYPRTYIKGQSVPAHRVSYEMAYGPIPNGLFVCHDCDKFYEPGDKAYRLCVRPDHLFLGTNADNMADCKRKGRIAFGVKQGSAKLRDDQVIEIRKRYKAGGITQRKLAREYGVSRSLVDFIVKGERWRHLPM